MSGFRKAAKADKYLVMSIQGGSGSGKTRSALEIAKHLCPPGKRIALIDSENSAELYSDVVDFDVDSDFGPLGKVNYHQDVWMKKILAAAASGEYGAIVLDSCTHLWKGEGGFLAQIDAICAAQRAKGGKGDSFAAWKSVDPLYAKFVAGLRQIPMHVIMCIRAKQAYEKVSDSGGRGNIRKVGMEPEFRDGFEYEMDIQAAIDQEHVLVPLKHRLGDCLDGKVFPKPGKDFADVCLAWLRNGAPGQAPVVPEAPEAIVTPVVALMSGTATLPLSTPTPEEVSPEVALQQELENAGNAETLNAVGKKIGQVRKEKTIDDAAYKRLSRLFSEKAKSFKAA